MLMAAERCASWLGLLVVVVRVECGWVYRVKPTCFVNQDPVVNLGCEMPLETSRLG